MAVICMFLAPHAGALRITNQKVTSCTPSVVQSDKITDEYQKDAMVFGIQICNDQTADPDRPSDALIRSYDRQLRQANVLLKSMAMFTNKKFHIAVVSDGDKSFRDIVQQVESWPNHKCEQITFSQHEMSYPKEANFLKYMNRPCSSQRHFFPQTFPQLGRIINLDTDIMLLSPIEDLWQEFHKFGEHNVIGMSAMIYAHNPKFRNFPKPQHEGVDDGINTGISLFDLQRWRSNFPNYTAQVIDWYKTYGQDFVFPTQDIFNVWLGKYPEAYFDLPCNWNVRTTLCHQRKTTPSVCRRANAEGAKALHGAGGHFVDGTPIYADMFNAFETHDMAKDTMETLISKIKSNVKQNKNKISLTETQLTETPVTQEAFVKDVFELELSPKQSCYERLGKDALKEIYLQGLEKNKLV